MASLDLSEEIAVFETAQYGRDIRSALVSMAEKLQDAYDGSSGTSTAADGNEVYY